MSLAVLCSGGPPGRPTGPRGARGMSLDSGGKPDAELISVNSPVSLLSENVVTEPVSSLSTYTNLLSLDVMKWRGPSAGFIRKTAGVFEARCPVLESNVNWNIASLPSVGTKTNLLLSSARLEWALRPTGITCSGSGATRPSRPTPLTATSGEPYGAPNRERPLLRSGM